MITYLSVFSQEIDLHDFEIVEFKNLDKIDEVESLKEILSNARIVLLGEQTHGEGATFDAKVKLIKFLHQEMGFEILAFESGLYSNYKANEISRSKNDTSPFNESVFTIWSDTKHFEELMKYFDDVSDSEHPLQIAGFDFQESNLFREYFFQDITKVFQRNNIHLEDSTIEILRETFFGDVDYISNNANDSIRFYSAVNTINAGFNKLFQNDELSRILQQAFNSYLAGIAWAVDMDQNRDYKVQNPRDQQMAENLIFLSDLYRDKKIIGWGASYHFANKIETYQNTDLTRQYITIMEEEKSNDKNEKFDLDEALDGASPMGRI